MNDNDEDTPAAGICGRTEEVREQLRRRHRPPPSPTRSTCPARTDFAGLTGRDLQLTTRKDVFAADRVLTLYYNELTTLPDGVRAADLAELSVVVWGTTPGRPSRPPRWPGPMPERFSLPGAR